MFSQEAMRRLMAHDWPGNIRQLENVIERALALTPGRSQIDVGDLQAGVGAGPARQASVDVTLPEEGVDLQRYVHDVERELIRHALERTGGNKNKAAQLLGIKRTTLVEKAKRLGLDREEDGSPGSGPAS